MSAINDLLDKWSDAELAADTGALGDYLADDYVGIGPFGFTLTKEEWLQRHTSGDLKYNEFKLVERNTREYGDAAIVVGVQDATATYQGKPVPVQGTLRFSATVVRVAGEWKVAGFQLSQMGLPQGGPPR
jgi:ketosteroid isomerase-like protein